MRKSGGSFLGFRFLLPVFGRFTDVCMLPDGLPSPPESYIHPRKAGHMVSRKPESIKASAALSHMIPFFNILIFC